MKLKNQPKVLASTINNNVKTFTVLIDVPYVLLPELMLFNKLSISYKKLDDIAVEDVVNNPFTPILDKYERILTGIHNSYLISDCKDIWHIARDEMLNVYPNLIREELSLDVANLIFAPFVYTTCIITGKGRDFDNLFETLCPKYVVPFDANTLWDKTFKSKKEAKSYISEYWEEDGEEVLNHMDTNNVWTKINKSKVRPELQYIAEMLYNLYQSCNWKESSYHIAFEDDVINLLSGKYRLLTDETKSWNKDELPIWIDCESGEEVDIDDEIIKLSASICSKFNYNINNESLQYHIDNAAKLIENSQYEQFNHSIIW